MPLPENCHQNTDPLKLRRDGTNQEERLSLALKPSHAPVNERTPAHGMLFARAFAAYLRFFDGDNTSVTDWAAFFSYDISVRLAVAAIQSIGDYKSNIKSNLDFLNNLDNETGETALINHLSYLFSCTCTLAKQLDVLKEGLPREDEEPPSWLTLRTSLLNLIQSQLAPALQHLISWHKAGVSLSVINHVAPSGELKILGVEASGFIANVESGFSNDWITDGSADWSSYTAAILPDGSVFGNPAGTVFELTNHISTHNFFTTVLDQFLKVYARVIADAQAALETSFTSWDRHDPHYALFLGFLRLFEYAREEANTLSGRHLDFYYRDILHLKERPATSPKAHLIATLAKQAVSHHFKTGDGFLAGKDILGKEVLFTNNTDLVANQAMVTALKSVYRHFNEPVGSGPDAAKHTGRYYASPVADSADGSGKKTESDDKSWHPFCNKIYRDGDLTGIEMPEAETGFTIASNYLLLAEGERIITLMFTLGANSNPNTSDFKDDIVCLVTGEKGWTEMVTTEFGIVSGTQMRLTARLSGADPAVVPYLAKTHGYGFDTNLPLIMVKLRHRPDHVYIYTCFEELEVHQVQLSVKVTGLKTLAISNDFGSVDSSKPFQPFGAMPVSGNSLIIGSAEVFQKNLTSLTIRTTWLETPDPYGSNIPNINFDFLNSGIWKPSSNPAIPVISTSVVLLQNLLLPVKDEADLGDNKFYSNESRQGYVKLKLDADFGQKAYQTDLLKYVRKDAGALDPGAPPAGPFMNSLSVDYTAAQTLILNTAAEESFTNRSARFYHLYPFGHAEEHAYLSSDMKTHLLPQFDFERDSLIHESEAEFYIGVTGLKPPQNLSLLFQVADGTANPLSLKPSPHLHLSFLSNNEWVAFNDNDMVDQTEGLLKSGILTLAVPSPANTANTLLPAGQHWIRIAVSESTDTVCRLLMVSAQAMLTTFINRDNDPAFPATVLSAGTISKPEIPDAEIKKISQPYDSFGGKAAEIPESFYTRVSERLRHKDRAITLWDYEHLVLDAFPEIYRVKCLNHTQYEPTESGEGIYRELAPGNVTIITVPNKQFHNQRDPLRPYTSLGTLQEISSFLKARVSCFVKLHVRNPQFEEVNVNFKLKLYDGFDESFYTNLLKESITRFLSPWAFPGGESPSFGGKIYKSVLVDFVEEQAYVDYVTDFELFHTIDGVQGTSDLNEIEGSRAVSILVSVPAAKHGITVIHPAAEEIAAEQCNCKS
ncbi:MAG: baseplate J/gp47 family protein [Bacteroidota bacterium]